MATTQGPLDYVLDLFFKPIPVLSKSKNAAQKSQPQKNSGLVKAAGKKGEPSKVTASIVSLQGTVEPGGQTAFSVQGKDFVIDGNTWMFGELQMGTNVEVQAVLSAGVLKARKVRRL